MMPPPPIRLSHRERGWRIALCITAILTGIWLVFMPPALKTGGHFCGFHAATGLPCGLCGGTRALRAASAGNLREALTYNAAALPAVSLAGMLLLFLAAEGISGRPLISRMPPRVQRMFLLAGFAVFVVWSVLHAGITFQNRHPQLVNENHPIVRALRKATN
jgi:hypothetical protein